MEIKSLKDWVVHGLKDVYSAENQVLEALPKMADAASNKDLKQAFQKHRDQTEGHVDRVVEALNALGEKPDQRLTCKGMKGLITKGEEILKKKSEIPADVLDVALLESAQKVEHYEIVSYASLVTYAELLGKDDVVKLLKKSLDEEKSTDEKLNKLAESGINRAAKVKAAG